MTGYACVSLAGVTYEWDDLAQTEHLLRQAVLAAEESTEVATLLGVRLSLIRLRCAQGDLEAARETLADAELLVSMATFPWFGQLLASWNARIALLKNDGATVRSWLETEGPRLEQGVPPVALEPAYINLTRGRVAEGRAAGEADRLDALRAKVDAEGRLAVMLEILVNQALARDGEGLREEALALLERALALGEPECYTRTFLDEGPRLLELLRVVAGRRHVPAAQRLLLAASRHPPLHIHPPADTRLLSERELQVLQLVADGRSNREAAEELFLSVGTVKKHIYNVCAKLDAHSRTAAVARARERGLI
jgi:LuxR family maltose regulon positive regulatory protein